MLKNSIILSLYKSEKFIKRFFENYLTVVDQNSCELIIIHNDPSENEKSNILNNIKDILNIQYIIVPRETLYRSWNRAIRLAKGKYIFLWNIDDILADDAIEKMVHTLVKNPNIVLTYGNYQKIYSDKNKLECYSITHEFSESRKEFLRGQLCGPFYMVKSEILKEQFYDEQFLSGGDFELLVRLAYNYDFRKTDSLIGFLYKSEDTLSGNSIIQPIERTVVELRYGIFDNINFRWIIRAIKKYKIFRVKIDDSWIPISEYIPNYWHLWISNLPLFFLGAFIKFPFYIFPVQVLRPFLKRIILLIWGDEKLNHLKLYMKKV